MLSKTLLTALLVERTVAFPWVALQPGVNTGPLEARQQSPTPGTPGSASTCAFNPHHVPAVGITPQYPYNNASGGNEGNGVGGYPVPAPGDTAHYYIAPNYTTDIRGPCPGLNTAANHGFLARDGIVTFNELVDAQQNLYNVGYDLAQLLAVLGLTTTDGDIATERLSIGCEATTRTSVSPTLTGPEPGLDGHNKFEADSSLTRNDFFTHGGDNYNFNGTLFAMMANTTGGNFDLQGMGLYRYQRYLQSRAENPNFYFGPLALLLYGAAAFVYGSFPSANANMDPNLSNTMSFFGAQKTSTGGYAFNGGERIPANWTARVDPFSASKIGQQIFEMYGLYPVEFGGNTGNGQFDLYSGPGGISNGKLNATSGNDVSCLLYQIVTDRIPSSLNGISAPTVAALNFALAKLSPGFQNLGCPFALT